MRAMPLWAKERAWGWDVMVGKCKISFEKSEYKMLVVTEEFYTDDYSLWTEKILMMCFLLLRHLWLGSFAYTCNHTYSNYLNVMGTFYLKYILWILSWSKKLICHQNTDLQCFCLIFSKDYILTLLRKCILTLNLFIKRWILFHLKYNSA